MQALKVANNARTFPVLLYTGVPLIIIAALWATSVNDVTLPQIIAAFILCWIPGPPTVNGTNGTRDGIPLFSLVGATYWLAYTVPLFWTETRY